MTAWHEVLKVENLTPAEVATLREAVFIICTRRATKRINENTNPWNAMEDILRESSGELVIQGLTPDEAKTIRDIDRQEGKGNSIQLSRDGTTGRFLTPKMALQAMEVMALQPSRFNHNLDVPGINTLLAKMWQSFGRVLGIKKPMEVTQGGESVYGANPNESGEPDPALMQAKFAETEKLPELQSSEEFERMTQQMYAPKQGPGINPTAAQPDLVQSPATKSTFENEPDPIDLTGMEVEDEPAKPQQFARANLGAAQAARGQNRGQEINNMGDTTLSQKEDNLIDKGAVAAAPEENFDDLTAFGNEVRRIRGQLQLESAWR